MTKPSHADFPAVHAKLRAIMRKYEKGSLKAGTDKPNSYALIGPPAAGWPGKHVWFGAVQTKKSYVSYHLMAVYAFPDLLRGVSPDLKRHMQGKSCFNFREVEPALFRELAQLTADSYNRLRMEGLVS